MLHAARVPHPCGWFGHRLQGGGGWSFGGPGAEASQSGDSMRLLDLSLCAHVRDSRVRPAPGMRWADLVGWLKRPMRAESKDRLPLWSAATFEGERRSKRAARLVHALVLDVDGGASVEDVASRWAGWEALIHTSWSHSEACPKFRVVLPLLRPVEASMWASVFRWAQMRSGGVVDEATKDPSRIWYAPAQGPNGPFRVEHQRGRWLEVPAEAFRETERPARRRALPPSRVMARDAHRVFCDRLKTDAGLRRWAGQALGGRVGQDSVRGVLCPDCNRPSMWWPFHPKGTPQAMCNRRNSCGSVRYLDELLAFAGVQA